MHYLRHIVAVLHSCDELPKDVPDLILRQRLLANASSQRPFLDELSDEVQLGLFRVIDYLEELDDVWVVQGFHYCHLLLYLAVGCRRVRNQLVHERGLIHDFHGVFGFGIDVKAQEDG